MESEAASSLTKAEEDKPSRQEDYFFIDLESQSANDFVPNRLQSILTLQWLAQHYEPVEGVSLPRCLIYQHYSDYCRLNQFRPVNAASFGKVIRQVFPELRTRRLGTRGQSKYHYYGIRVKESSPYFGVFLDSQRVTGPALYRSPGFPVLSSKIPEQSDNPQATMTSVLTLLPDFPTAAQTQPWDDAEFEQVDAVISQYRCHCQRIIESILQGRLEEVSMAVQQFWQSLSDSTRQVLQGGSSDKLADLIALCDNILYQTMMNILVPGTVQQLPPSLLHAIRHFSCGFQRVIEDLPILVKYLHFKRVETAKRFCQLLKRKTSLSHLAQATRAVLKTKVTVTQMSHDWRKRTEQNTVCSQLMWTTPDSATSIKTVVKKCFSEFSRLLEKHASVEDHIKWLHSVRSKCLKSSGDGDSAKDEAERNFLLQWSYVCNLLIRDQTLRSATSFGSFHLLHLLYEEYLLYMVDVQRNQKQERALWKRLFDTDVQVPSYFLTNGSEFDEVRVLPSAPFVTPEQLCHFGPSSVASATAGQSSKVSVDFVGGMDRGGSQYICHSDSISSGRLYAKPAVAITAATAAVAARSPYQSAVLGSAMGGANRYDVTYTVPLPSTSVLNPKMPSKNPQGYISGAAASSPLFQSPKQSSSPKSHQPKKEQDVSCGSLSLGRGPSIVTVPIGGSISYLQTSPSRGGIAGSVTVLPGGNKVTSSPVALTIPSHVVTQRRKQPAAAASAAVHEPTGSSSREPPPLQPIAPSNLRSPAGKHQPILPQPQKPQQKLVATKLVKGVAVSSESQQKPVSLQFSITTSQKLNLAKGQILTTTNGERYVINEVQTTTLQGDNTPVTSSGQGK